MFTFYNPHNNDLYNNLVKLSRNIFFYKDISLKDDFDTRIILIFLHFSIIIKKFKKGKFPQKLFDNIFQNIEYNLREEGYGDVSVNKKMKILNKIFYDILLKLEKKNSDKFIINNEILIKYLNSKNSDNRNNISKLSNYFGTFNDFCFELDDVSMLKGQINFKY